MNTFGRLFKISTFGESHGVAIGGVIDGVPSGIELDFDWIQAQLDRRKPGQSAIVTQRKEPDTVQFLSGIFEGKTTGASIGFIIPNDNQKSHDYDHIKGVFVLLMPILHTKPNMVFAIIKVEEELLRAKRRIGL